MRHCHGKYDPRTSDIPQFLIGLKIPTGSAQSCFPQGKKARQKQSPEGVQFNKKNNGASKLQRLENPQTHMAQRIVLRRHNPSEAFRYHCRIWRTPILQLDLICGALLQIQYHGGGIFCLQRPENLAFKTSPLGASKFMPRTAQRREKICALANTKTQVTTRSAPTDHKAIHHPMPLRA